MNIWITADTHFGHKNIVKYCNRPENFNELIIKELSVIKDEDILIHLGDVCIRNDSGWHETVIEKLKCRKYLCIGNHDHKGTNWYLNHGWDFACYSFTAKMFGKDIIFSHMPIENPKCLNIHGHVHNSTNGINIDNMHRLVSIELNNYKPINLINLIK